MSIILNLESTIIMILPIPYSTNTKAIIIYQYPTNPTSITTKTTKIGTDRHSHIKITEVTTYKIQKL